ncbi:hypothetical protein L208DRAFT_1381545 [Tricholoma matsutake]|nr:hypothetical protein L208DRAFT_1381545 [Tricholoma matsutake 945]
MQPFLALTAPLFHVGSSPPDYKILRWGETITYKTYRTPFRALPRGINNQDLQNLGQNLEVGTCYSALTCVKMGQCVNIVLPSRLSMRRVDSGLTDKTISEIQD